MSTKKPICHSWEYYRLHDASGHVVGWERVSGDRREYSQSNGGGWSQARPRYEARVLLTAPPGNVLCMDKEW